MLLYFWTISLLLSAALLIYFALLKYLSWNFDFWKKNHVCGPTPVPWHGTFPKSRCGKCNLLEEMDEFYRQYKSAERYIGIFTARDPKLFILDPMLAKQILTTNFKDFRDNESSKWAQSSIDLLRNQSPFVAVGEAWREKRLELASVLTTSRLRSFQPVFQQSSDKLINYIKNHLGVPLDAKEVIGRFTADFLSSFIWDLQGNVDAFEKSSLGDIQKMGNKLIKQTTRCVQYYGQTANFPWLRKIFPVRFFPKITDEFFLQLASYASKIRTSTAAAGGQGNVINHLLQLRDKKSLSEIQIAGHTTTILIDGFETAAIVSAHLLLLLARNPRVQQKLREELNAVVGEWSYDNVNSLQYLDQCVNETLRIFPPLATLFKLCTKDTRLENKDGSSISLKTGVGVFISSNSFQRDPDYYEQPENFWPERFNVDTGGVRKFQDMGVFMPFGDGPRMCPGIKLGISEVKMSVAGIVRNFYIRPSEMIRLDNQIAAGTFLVTFKDSISLIFEEI